VYDYMGLTGPTKVRITRYGVGPAPINPTIGAKIILCGASNVNVGPALRSRQRSRRSKSMPESICHKQHIQQVKLKVIIWTRNWLSTRSESRRGY
jgi:hypothetical protein